MFPAFVTFEYIDKALEVYGSIAIDHAVNLVETRKKEQPKVLKLIFVDAQKYDFHQ